MREWIAKLSPNSWLGQKLLLGLVLVAACTGTFFWGKRQNADAQQSTGPNPFYPTKESRDGRIVAYIGNNPVFREELGEYLIERFGPERLEFMVNRRIVEIECAKHGIRCTNDEVEYRFRQDLSSFGKLPLTEKEFVQSVLKRFGKTLVEWKEDVIRPKILMEKLVRAQVKVTDQEVINGFEARFGPKVECRMIVVQGNNSAVLQETYNRARQGREQFIAEAKKNFIPSLAQEEGKVPAIHKHFGDKAMEDVAFRLRENEVSEPLKMPDGTYVILMCDRHIGKDVNARFENYRLQVMKEVEDFKVAQKIPEVFAKMHKDANPRLVLQHAVSHLARTEPPQRTGVNAFDHVPSGELPMPTNLPAPNPGKVLPPEGHGVVPSLPQVSPPAPISGLPPINAPKLDTPESKK